MKKRAAAKEKITGKAAPGVGGKNPMAMLLAKKGGKSKGKNPFARGLA